MLVEGGIALIVARGVGLPGRGGARLFPLAWRRFILANATRKALFKGLERPVRKTASLPSLVPGYGFLLSFPRSGNHWVRYIIESISGYSTLGARQGVGPGNSTLWVDTPIRMKVSIPGVRRTAVVMKRHHVRQPDSRTAPLVFLVRRPHQAIISHRLNGLSSPRILTEATARFIELCATVDSWKGTTTVLYFEDDGR